MDVFETFVAVLFAFIVKDFYDIFISIHIKKAFMSYKSVLAKKEIEEKYEEQTQI
jgi:hypothetical protein